MIPLIATDNTETVKQTFYRMATKFIYPAGPLDPK